MRRGVAIDIGTTTVAMALVDCSTGRVLSDIAFPNPQRKWGADVLSRVRAILDAPALLEKMSGALIERCNSALSEFGVSGERLDIAICGNSVMEHLLLKVSPKSFAAVPYKPVFKESKTLSAKDAGFDVSPDSTLYVFPIIGGFVGGDAVAVALHLGMHKKDIIRLAIDLGTNSEILLETKTALFATSAAAGPAFEAGGLKQGMIAEPGAIRDVSIKDDRVTLDVVGGVAPKGICGSGLISTVSELLRRGIIEPNGRIRSKDEIPDNLSVKIREGANGNAFLLHRGPKVEVSLDQGDVRSLQTAKAAIRAGIDILLRKAGLEPDDVQSICIAGAFGSNIDQGALARIGLLPDIWMERVGIFGDAALDGAILALKSNGERKDADDMARDFHYVSLSGSAHFEKEFISNMDFPGPARPS